MSSREDLRSRWILGGAAAFAMAWAVARAAVQSITIDEAGTYNMFVARHLYLSYAANNHILSSTLMYGFTRLLGPSQFTARLPALLGAALYIAAVYRLCRLLGASVLVQLTIFVCLVFDPFIFDHLVAARGYGLALAFLLWAMVYFAENHTQERFLVVTCGVSSVCAGLSVDANFSFAIVNLATMSVIFLRARRQQPHDWVNLLAACTLPAAAVIAIVSSYALLHYQPGELIYGAHSLGEEFGSIIESSLFQNRFILLKPVVFPLVGVTGLLWLSYLLRGKVRARIARFGWAAAAIFAVTVTIHWLLFWLFGLLLPKDRTAIYLFPLFMIIAGVLAAIPSASRLGGSLRACFIGSLAVMAVYFLLCLRLTYFKEWYWDSDVQRTYAVLSCLNRTHQVTHIASTWSYHGPLNFYQHVQAASLPTPIQEIDETFDPQQAQVYVVDMLHTPEALDGKDLKIFYRSPTTDTVLAASPPLAETYAAGTCLRE
jgi:hypothetical protein